MFTGRPFGARATVCGEVVFSTAMTGYQESLTDPSYRGQILVSTPPHVGNYGVCGHDVEAGEPQIRGFAVREMASLRSNCRSEEDLPAWLERFGIPGISEIDTRALVRRLRAAGVLRGVLALADDRSDAELVAAAKALPVMAGQDLATQAGANPPSSWGESLDRWWPGAGQPPAGPPYRVVAIDCGAKRNIFRHLVAAGCEVLPVAAGTSAEAILAMEPEGVFISNGPGDPAAVTAVIEPVRAMIGEVPMFGICLGHQLLALALGARTWKLPFGHRGVNQPVRDLEADRIFITSQNHGFCVDADSLEAAGCLVTHRHLNDDTVAGFRHATLPIRGVQFHPEASPGPHEAACLFKWFSSTMATRRSAGAVAGKAP